MEKRKWVLLLAAMLTVFLLCGCSQYDDQYDNEDFLTDGMNHYATILWNSDIQRDGSLTLSAGSFTGVKTLGSFTVAEDQTLCEAISTLSGIKGEAKLLVVRSRDETLVAQWPLDTQDPLTVTLPAGRYTLRIAGKSAKFKGKVSLTLDGQAVAWDSILEDVQEKIEAAVSAKPHKMLHSLRLTFGTGKRPYKGRLYRNIKNSLPQCKTRLLTNPVLAV